jgi:hypothetical protein
MNLLPPYPDREQVLLDILSVLVDENDVPILGVTWLPPDFEPPIYQVQRIGGGADEWGVTDYGLMRVSYYGATRNEAWQLSQAGESVVLSHHQRGIDRPGRYSDGMLVDWATLDVGGSMDPDLDPDDRRVTVNYTLGMRRQFHLLEAQGL